MASPIKHKEVVYELLGQSKHEWLRTSRNLYTAANILYDESAKSFEKLTAYLEKAGSASDEWFPEAGMHLVARMLAGMSIENLIKGLILQKQPSKISKGKFNIQDHNLINLLDKNLPEISFTKKERGILEELTKSIKWKGKYPIPLGVGEYEHAVQIKDEVPTIQTIYEKLKKQYS